MLDCSGPEIPTHGGSAPAGTGTRLAQVLLTYADGAYRRLWRRLVRSKRPEMEASMKSQTPKAMSLILSNPILRIAMLRIATDQRTWILAGALAAAGVRRWRKQFDLQGRTVLITDDKRALGLDPRWHERC